MFWELEAPKCPSIERYVCWNVSWPASTDSLAKTPDFLLHWNVTPVTVVHHCIRCQCFILLPNVWVVFKIYFAILHNIVARNNVQHCIRLNKQKGEKKSFHTFALHPGSQVTHPGHLLWAHGRDVMTCKRCVEIFLKAVMFDKKLTLNIYI